MIAWRVFYIDNFFMLYIKLCYTPITIQKLFLILQK